MTQDLWLVPLADVQLGDAEVNAVTAVLRSGWLTMGECTLAFEEAFAEYLGVRHAFAVSNGTTALHLAYAALGLDHGDEVIVPSLTFVATANAATYTGATPVFADITSTQDFSISPASVERLITPATRAICVVHYAGYPVDMDSITEIARRHNIAIVEDAAHAPGATYTSCMDGKSLKHHLGTLGDVGCFSFFSNKNLVVGEGGMVVTNRDDLAEQIRLMRSHGMTTLTWDRHKGHASRYDVVSAGFNYRMDEVRSALGLVQLSQLDAKNERRGELVAYYRQALQAVSGVEVPFENAPGQPSYHIMPILIASGISRDKVMASMKAQRIQTSIHYPPIHMFTYYRERYGLHEDMFPLTEDIAARELTLPLYPTMGEENVDQVVAAVKIAIDWAQTPN